MIEVTVRNLSGEITHQARFETQVEADAWISSQVSANVFKPERWIDSEDLLVLGENRDNAIASQEVGEASRPGESRVMYKFAADYTMTQVESTHDEKHLEKQDTMSEVLKDFSISKT